MYYFVRMNSFQHKLTLKRKSSSQQWGFNIAGGNDVSLPFRVQRVEHISPAGEAGLKDLDYLIKVNEIKVFDKECSLSHNELVHMVKHFLGDSLELVIER